MSKNHLRGIARLTRKRCGVLMLRQPVSAVAVPERILGPLLQFEAGGRSLGVSEPCGLEPFSQVNRRDKHRTVREKSGAVPDTAKNRETNENFTCVRNWPQNSDFWCSQSKSSDCKSAVGLQTGR